MLETGKPCIVRGYCGILVLWEVDNLLDASLLYTIVLQDRNDPRITIRMEGLSLNELIQNSLP